MNYENKRDIIINELESLIRKEIVEKNFFKVHAYKKVIDQISKIENVYSISDLKDVEGIGEKIKKKIIEIFETGKLTSAERARIIPNIEIYNQLMNIYGIGITKADELIKIHNIKSIDELIEMTKINPKILNEKQRTGLQYYLDLQTKIPKSEIDRHGKLLKTIAKDVNKHIEIKIVGSYRRGSKESSDIDVIFTVNKIGRTQNINTNKQSENEHKKLFKLFIEKLKDIHYLIADLATGTKKYMGISRLKKQNEKARRIDILYSSLMELPFTMVYFTGDFDINVELRKRAKEMGYTLNEHGLQNISDKTKIHLKTEKEIFNFLGYKFLQPRQRSLKNLKSM